ncbi:GNAT family N-acetyltransferase [Flavisphingomonas formosensis]|uniref:GNAT family N-acetyltransferase n=1 Tax=Flavisphingomonas formosensis TaxID=861534 RepID=UPI0012FC8D81|nr:GNAT family N-acetyltransferase [Sphingomonas formosensis]
MFARTDRLLLRPGWLEDAPALAAAIGDEAVASKLARVPLPYGLAEAEAYLSRQQDPLLPDFLIFTRTRGAPRLVGGIGLFRDIAGEAELGYWIARDYWGLGFATEAGRAVIDLARDSLRLPRVVSGHFIDNPASGRVLRKLGFRPVGRYASRHNLARDTILPCALYALDTMETEASPLAA